MGLGNLLFSTNGRISKNRFWQGVVILVATQLVLTIIGLMLPQSNDVSALSFLIIFGSMGFYFYTYLCVYGKRLHDAGTTGNGGSFC